MKNISIRHKKTGHWLAQRAVLADSWTARLRGWLGKKQTLHGEGLLLIPCRSIHTFAMSISIDAVFLDQEYRVVKLVSNLVPWRVCGASARACSVLELPAGTVQKTGLAVDDELIVL